MEKRADIEPSSTREPVVGKKKLPKAVVGLIIASVVLVVVGVVVGVVMVFAGGSAATLTPSATPSRYQFTDYYYRAVDPPLECGGEDDPCTDSTCSTCNCPERCAAKGARYMGLSGGQDGSFKCHCSNDQLDITYDGPAWPVEEYTLLDGKICQYDVWQAMDKWTNVLPPEESDPRNAWGCGGLYAEDAPNYLENPRRKLYSGVTFNDGGQPFVALYENKAFAASTPSPT